MVDGFNRRVTYLRLSVTDRCDLRCRYCMPERMRFAPPVDLLSVAELVALADAFVARGVTRIRLTGGEPLVRGDCVAVAQALGERLGKGLMEWTLTTNGTRLTRLAALLREAGLQRVNVSLDTRNPDLFARLTRRDALAEVLAGIAAAKAAGLRVKINTVALRGLNEGELPELIAWAHGEGHELTIIETMPLGVVDEDRTEHYLPIPAVRAALAERFTLLPLPDRTGGPARYVRVAETGGRLGFIAPLSENFCAGCNRVRVTATGQLYPCLGGGNRVDLRAALRSGGVEAVNRALDAMLLAKPDGHRFEISRVGAAPAQPRHMSVTGG